MHVFAQPENRDLKFLVILPGIFGIKSQRGHISLESKRFSAEKKSGASVMLGSLASKAPRYCPECLLVALSSSSSCSVFCSSSSSFSSLSTATRIGSFPPGGRRNTSAWPNNFPMPICPLRMSSSSSSSSSSFHAERTNLSPTAGDAAQRAELVQRWAALGKKLRACPPEDVLRAREQKHYLELINALQDKLPWLHGQLLMQVWQGAVDLKTREFGFLRVLIVSTLYQVSSLNPQGLSTVFWAMGQLEMQEEKFLIEALSQQAISCSHLFDPSAVTKTFRALPKLQPVQQHTKLVDSLVEHTLTRLARISPNELSRMLNSLSSLGYALSPNQVELLRTHVLQVSQTGRPEVAALLLQSLPRTGQFSVNLVKMLSESLVKNDQWGQPNLLGRVLESMIKLGCPPDKPQLKALCNLFLKHAHTFAAVEVASTLTALDKLNYDPGPEVLAVLCKAALGDTPSFSSLQIAHVLHALSKFRYTSDNSELLDLLCHRAASKIQLLDDFQLALILNGLANLNHHPGDFLLSQFATQAYRQVNILPTKGVAMILNSFGKLGYKPQTSVVNGLLQRAFELRHQLNSQDISNVLHALAKLQHDPGKEIMQPLYEEVVRKLSSFNNQEVANTLYATAVQLYDPGKAVVRLLLEEVRNRASVFKAQEVGSIWFALGKLRYTPEEPLLFALNQAVQINARLFTAHALLNVLTGMAKLTYYPGKELLDLLNEAVVKKASEFNSADVSQTVNAFMRLNYHPSQECYEALIDAAKDLVETFTPDDTCGMLHALVVLDRFEPELFALLLSHLRPRGITPDMLAQINMVQLSLRVEHGDADIVVPSWLATACRSHIDSLPPPWASPLASEVSAILQRDLSLQFSPDSRLEGLHIDLSLPSAKLALITTHIFLPPPPHREIPAPGATATTSDISQPLGRPHLFRLSARHVPPGQLARRRRVRRAAQLGEQKRPPLPGKKSSSLSQKCEGLFHQRDLCKERLLRAMGWQVVHVPSHEWTVLTEEEKPPYLRQKLVDAVKGTVIGPTEPGPRK
eukprot:g28580.t1